MDKWKNRKEPELNDLLSIAKTNPQLSDCVVGQLIIESLVVKLIDTKLDSPDALDSFKLSFPEKMDLCVSMGLLTKEFTSFLMKLNTARNKFAHRLGYELSFSEIYELIVQAGKVGVEFTDDVNKSIKFAQEVYDPPFLLKTVFDNTSHYLSILVSENGGEYSFL